MTKRRALYVDHLRITLTVLVILHHAAITYGGAGEWYWRDQETDLGNDSHRALSLFTAVNQSYFMGFFFLLAGYLTPAAYDRKGPRNYFIDRLARLGIPLLIYGFLIAPITIALAQMGDGKPFFATLILLLKQAYFGLGPLWFIEALLLFNLGYMAWRAIRPRPANPPFPSHRALFLSAIVVGIAAFLIRLVVPAGKQVFGLQLGYFASYVFLYVAGCLAFRGNWFKKITLKQIGPWFILSLISIPTFPLASLLVGTEGFSGGIRWIAVMYAVWEPLVAWGLILMYLWCFRTYLDRPLPGCAWLAEHNYAVYVIHASILVGTSLLYRPWLAPSLLKFAVTGLTATVLCYVVASLLLWMPGAKRVL